MLSVEGRSTVENSGTDAPAVSVVMPAYKSERTIFKTLDSLRSQIFQDFEVVVFDSSPDPRTLELVRARCPEVRIRWSSVRHSPIEARRRAVSMARGDLLVFTDPDVLADPRWLERLVDAHRRTGCAAVVGSLECAGSKPFDLSTHLCKSGTWLPVGPPRRIDLGPGANMLCLRTAFEEAWRHPPEGYRGDTVLSWKLRGLGHLLWFEPSARVSHVSEHRFHTLLRERFQRGRSFGRVRVRWRGFPRWRVWVLLLATVTPMRAMRAALRLLYRAARWRNFPDILITFPVVVAAQLAELMGETIAYSEFLVHGPGEPEDRSGIRDSLPSSARGTA